jgi:hypothetical protein
MKCPYPDCEKHGMKPPKIGTPRPHGYCPHCKRKARATVSFVKGVETVTKYSVASLPRLDRLSIKGKIYKVRLSEKDIVDIENGSKKLVMKNGKALTLAVIVVQSQYIQ